MEIRTSRDFDKSFKKRISFDKRLVAQFLERVVLLEKGEDGGLLKVHALTGSKKGLFAFSVTGDIRVIFQKISEEEIVLVDIGSHNQVY